MITDWKEIALRVGSLHKDRSESGGDSYGQAVDHIIAFRSGSSVATNCLRLIHSQKAAIYVYEIYKSSIGDRADRAVFLIKDLAHPISFQWVEEFLNDVNVIHWGLGVLDQLLWTKQIPYDDKVEALLQLAMANSGGQLANRVDFIRSYLQARIENGS